MTKDLPIKASRLLDSNRFATGIYKPHGHSIVSVDGPIFRIQTTGPFNIEAVDAINRLRAQLFQDTPPPRLYAFINSWCTSVLMAEEVLTEYKRGLREAYLGRFVPPSAMAWIFPESIEGGSLMKPHFERIFSEARIPFRIFTDPDLAESWVLSLLRPSST